MFLRDLQLCYFSSCFQRFHHDVLTLGLRLHRDFLMLRFIRSRIQMKKKKPFCTHSLHLCKFIQHDQHDQHDFSYVQFVFEINIKCLPTPSTHVWHDFQFCVACSENQSEMLLHIKCSYVCTSLHDFYICVVFNLNLLEILLHTQCSFEQQPLTLSASFLVLQPFSSSSFSRSLKISSLNHCPPNSPSQRK